MQRWPSNPHCGTAVEGYRSPGTYLLFLDITGVPSPVAYVPIFFLIPNWFIILGVRFLSTGGCFPPPTCLAYKPMRIPTSRCAEVCTWLRGGIPLPARRGVPHAWICLALTSILEKFWRQTGTMKPHAYSEWYIEGGMQKIGFPNVPVCVGFQMKGHN